MDISENRELQPDVAATGAELLDLVVRLNRWATDQTVWTVPLTQVRVLSRLDQWGAARVTALAQAELCSQPTITKRVQAMEAQGWLARAPDPTDARSWLLTLTAAGRATLAQARGARARVMDDLLAQLPAGVRGQLQAATGALRVLLAAAEAGTPNSNSRKS